MIEVINSAVRAVLTANAEFAAAKSVVLPACMFDLTVELCGFLVFLVIIPCLIHTYM